MEAVSRRMETKRKGDEPEGRKTKKRMFPSVEGWGEADNPSHGGGLDAWVCHDDVNVVRTVQVISDDRIEKET